MIVPRTCTEISVGNEDQHREKEPRSFEEFQDVSAYVLLGDPGAGKTTAFKTECKKLREKACLITARDFLTFNPQSHPEWRDKTLFIDGLDEIRVGANDARTPFDQIRGRLDELGKPRFRLSCREADWLGANDRKRLEFISPDSKVTVLRLNPLTDSDIAVILEARSDIRDAQEFITLAQEQRVEGLLTNPQTLEMLADVVGDDWPKSRKETFEMACRQMIREHNEERKAAQAPNSLPAPDQLLDAAGRLCAVQVISGAAGYTLHSQADEEYPALDQYDYDHREMLRPALDTKLFKGVSDNDYRFTPVHRHIAEFLGARHLAEVIKSGLPAQRIIALIVGEDGTVVTEMRGLSAWLAAHCKDARAALIKRDPIGVVLYGDIREFSTDEKRALLEALNREASRLDLLWRIPAAFGALATSDMEPELKAILTDSSREEEHLSIADFVLHVLTKGDPLKSLSELLLEIVRDDTRGPDSNTLALDAFIHNCPYSEDKTSKLKALLADIQSGEVSDPNNELLGILLLQLYPQDLPLSEVWGYFSGERNWENSYSMYRYFWEIEILDRASDEEVAELLDHLHEWLPNLRPVLESSHCLRYLPVRLLARGLKAHGDQLDTEHLYDWLGVGMTEKGSWAKDKAIQEIRAWLRQRPEVEKAILTEGLTRCSKSDEFKRQAFNRLYGAGLPSDFGLWCLEQAVAIADTKPHVAELLLGWAVQAHTDQKINEGLSLEVLKEYAQKNAMLRSRLTQLLSPPSIPPESLEEDEKYTEERNQQDEQWFNYIRSNEVALRENRAPSDLLYLMALKYFGGFYSFSGDDVPENLVEELQGDSGLIDATLQGFRGAIDRKDIPDAKKILGLREKGIIHYLSLPFLAGLAEVERTSSKEDQSRWDDGQIRKAIAVYYCTYHMTYRPEWYERLLETHPEIVAEVQVQFAICEFRSGREHIYKLWELAHDPRHVQVAKHASLPLLRAFPTRCKLKQVQSLAHLLWAAIQHADRASLQELIETKLSRKSMNDAQRVYWLAAGLIVSPGAYSDLLRDFVQGREGRIRHLTEFFENCVRLGFSSGELGVRVLETLIRLVGSYTGPDHQQDDGSRSGYVKYKMEASKLVHTLIQNLATSPTKNTSDVLDSLCSDTALSRWHSALSQARDNQRVISSDASYLHPTIEQVCQTLNDGTPANAADLAALVMDQLRELADQIRRGNTDDWRQYWNEPHGQLPTPKHEDHCRNALLSDLRQRLPQGVDAQREGQYANDNRADIRVSYEDFQVPVEIKKNMHPDLWSAPRNQLIAQYTIDPDTDGYGIYLVFWFGEIDGRRTQPPPSGTQPTNSEELKKRLESTLSPNEARKISVCVIDVSRPD